MKPATWLVVVWVSLLAGGAIGTAAEPAKSADPPKSDEAATSDQGLKKNANRIQYAKTYIALAKLDLQIAQNRNKQVANTLPPAILLVMEEHVRLAELWLNQEEAEAGGKSPGDIPVKIAETRLKAAEMNYNQLKEADRISRQPQDKLERLRLRVELARLNVAGAKELDVSNPEQVLEFELERMREEVIELQIRQLKVLDRN